MIAASGWTKLAGFTLVGGVCAGALMALAIPTTMKQVPGEWRQMIGAREASASEDDAGIVFEAPPEDLTPVHWATAAQEYPAAGDTSWLYTPVAPVDELSEAQLDAILPDDLDQPAREQPVSVTAIADDDAASSAQAASEAAADVRAMESAIDAPAPDPHTALSSTEA